MGIELTEKEERLAESFERFINSIQDGTILNYMIPPYDKGRCRDFVGGLFKCIDRGQGIPNPSNSREKKSIANMMQNYYIDDIFRIFEMGKLAKAGNKRAQYDLVKWYASENIGGFDRRYWKGEANKILQRYKKY